ncbi:hypothetical protein LOAG_06564 [Loa loa]|uniref:Uncharacterized protein n=1 Tax=Loa loa TaxID=7209 RepID=A0A1S0TXP2_LOALO|nr:hypothetical protein LOAG_06564 [Loa loa]EFO21918.1 hypothetical protein LOAG_06564 [Loa loa]
MGTTQTLLRDHIGNSRVGSFSSAKVDGTGSGSRGSLDSREVSVLSTKIIWKGVFHRGRLDIRYRGYLVFFVPSVFVIKLLYRCRNWKYYYPKKQKESSVLSQLKKIGDALFLLFRLWRVECNMLSGVLGILPTSMCIKGSAVVYNRQ